MTAGKAQAAVASSLAARDSAAAVTRPAQEAIALGTPYRQEDSSAAFAVLTGQSSLTIAQQQAAAAAATAGLAEEFSAEAKALAAQAAADMKLALEASAAAADDALRAAKAYQRAQASANQAAADAKAAQASATRADGYAMSAGEDALAANWAANEAEQDAVAADRAATEAEHDAAHAREVATQAEADAAAARTAADKAEVDATAAEKAAEGARDAAEEAQAAADRTESAGNGEQIQQGVTTGIGGVWAVLDHIEYIGEPQNVVKENCNPIYHVGDCIVTADVTYRSHVDLYMCLADPGSYQYGCPGADTIYLGPDVTDPKTERLTNVISMVEFNAGIDPVDILLGDFIGCAKLITPGVSGGSWGDCAWAASWFVAGALFKGAKAAMMSLDAAVRTGIGFTEAWVALRSIGLTEGAIAGIGTKIIQRLQKACEKVDNVTPASFSLAAFSVSSTSANPQCWVEMGGPGVWNISREGGKSARAIAYEFQITGVPEGFGYLIRNTPNPKGELKLDGYMGGVLLEAKGPGYSAMMNSYKPRVVEEDFVKQARYQVEAAPNTPITWHIAEEDVYEKAKAVFAATDDLKRITVVYTPPTTP
ncbi:UNVERIFIED_CONTAM: chemotaxis protein histidine kinase CheA [Streptomyces canus]